MDSVSQAPSPPAGAGGDQALLRVELGGGRNPKEGFLNFDIQDLPGVDVVCDFNEPLPLEDDSVQEIYSCHCFEHVKEFKKLLHEVCRVCARGATVTISVPHFGNDMAMCPEHFHVISEQQVKHLGDFPEKWWRGSKKKLVFLSKSYRESHHLAEARTLFPSLTDEQIFRFVQNTCHDVTFVFEVRSNLDYVEPAKIDPPAVKAIEPVSASPEFVASMSVWNQAEETEAQIEKRIHDDAKTKEELYRRASDYSDCFLGDIAFHGSMDVVEIGPGLGYIMEDVEKKCSKVGIDLTITGVEYSPKMAELANKRIGSGKLSIVTYDGVNVPMEHESIDRVYSVAAIQHIPKAYAYNLFFEVHRILKDHGIFVFHYLPFTHIEKIGWSEWREEVDCQINHRSDRHWGFYYSPGELANVLKHGTGFSSVETYFRGPHAFCKCVK